MRKGQRHTKESIKKISDSKMGNDNALGHELTDETKKKISDSMTGKKHTDKAKKKMSDSRMGHDVTDETRKKLSGSMMGNKNGEGYKHNEQTRKKISDGNMGRVISKEHRIKISAANQGISVDDWTHFIRFEPYCELFNNRFKEMVRESFGRVCFLCPATERKNGEKLSVHHVNYDKNCLCESECDFVPLCRVCHATTAHNRDYWEALITEMLSGFWTEYEVK